MSKQRGAEMSSRLMPPYDGAIRAIASTSSSTVPVSMTTGTASMPAKCLKSTALPSMTGIAPSGPMSPEAEHGRAVADRRPRCCRRAV